MSEKLWVIEQLQEVIDKFQAAKIDGKLIDVQSASLIVAVFNKSSEATQQKMQTMPLSKVAKIAWNLVK